MKKLFPLAAILFLAACSARTRRFASYRFAGDAPAVTCRQDGAARWCLHEPPGPAAQDLVYFLHYATGDEGSWNRLGLSRAFYAEFKGRPAPRVVTVSYGAHWLLTRVPGLRQTVTLADFAALRGRIEASLGAPRRRFLWGMSQGGYNAAVLALSEPERWSAAALSCPALLEESPYAPPPPGTPFPRALEARQLFTYRLAGESAWAGENPLALARTAGTPPPFWIEANDADEFGFFSGARALAERLGGRARFVPAPGTHCVIDARAAARFIRDAAN